MKKQYKCQIVMQVLLIKFSRFSSHRCLERKSGNTSFYYPPVRFALTWPPPLVTNEIKLNEIEFPRALFRGSRFSTFCAIRNGNVLIVFHVDKMCCVRATNRSLFFSSPLFIRNRVVLFFFFFVKKIGYILESKFNFESSGNFKAIID